MHRKLPPGRDSSRTAVPSDRLHISACCYQGASRFFVVRFGRFAQLVVGGGPEYLVPQRLDASGQRQHVGAVTGSGVGADEVKNTALTSLQLPDRVDIVVLGRRAALTFLDDLAGVVQPEDGDVERPEP
jgi:hypothetical protein